MSDIIVKMPKVFKSYTDIKQRKAANIHIWEPGKREFLFHKLLTRLTDQCVCDSCPLHMFELKRMRRLMWTFSSVCLQILWRLFTWRHHQYRWDVLIIPWSNHYEEILFGFFARWWITSHLSLLFCFTGNVMTLKFLSDASVTAGGFQLEYTANDASLFSQNYTHYFHWPTV